MKLIYRTLLAFTIFSFFSISALSAQEKPFEFGFKGGLNLSYLAIDNDGVPHHRIKPGVMIGLTGNYNFNSRFFLQTGLGFSAKGARIKGDAPLGFHDNVVLNNTEPVLKSNQLYVQVPVHLGYNIALTTEKKMFFTAGPYLAYGVGGKTQLAATILYGDMIDSTPLEEQTFGGRGLRKLDYGLGAGVGIDLGEAIVGLTYELGLRNIGPENIVYLPFYDNSYRNRNLSLTVGFRF